MHPLNFVRTGAQWILNVLVAFTFIALAHTLMAGQEIQQYNASLNGQVPLQPTSCTATVLVGGAGNSANERAPNTNFRFGRAVYLITAAELAANGYAPGNSPTSIGWNYLAGGTAGASAPLIVYMENTADTTNTKSTTWATAIASMTTVHNGVISTPSVAGPWDITLTGGSPFTYTGGGLYIAFDWGQYTGTLSTTASISCNISIVGGLLGNQSQTAAPLTVAASNFRPETRLSSSTVNDNGVGPIYSLGEVPLGLAPAQVVRALILNKGTMTQTNVPGTLNVTGVDTFTDMQTAASLASCTGSSVLTFASFTPSALGNDTVAVSVPADDVATNNSATRPLSITPLTYSYKYPGTTASGGVGVNGGTATFVAKFPLTAANAVTDVKIEFPNVNAGTYKVAIYPDNGSGFPTTTPIYLDAANRTIAAAGPVTITLPSPVSVGPGNFYAGIQQTGTTNIGLGFDTEIPIRDGAFFLAIPIGGAFADASPVNNFKINVGVILQTAAPQPPVPSAAVSRKTHGGAGTFDIPLPLVAIGGAVGVECRSSGGVHQMVVTFPSPVTVGSAAVTSGTGSATFSIVGNDVVVDLTGVTNAQRLGVTLTNVSNGSGAGDVFVPMGILAGDANGSGGVSATDVGQVKANSGQPVTGTNFRADVAPNGSVTATDVGLVKSNSGTVLPP